MEQALVRIIDTVQPHLNTFLNSVRADLTKTAKIGAALEPNKNVTDLVEGPTTWKEAVLDEIMTLPMQFRFSDVYRNEEYYARHFPGNKSIKQSVAGALRELTSDGVIKQLDRGRYMRLDDSRIDTVDTVVVPARPDGFTRAALEQHKWWAISLHADMIPRIKNIAFYQTAPISAITHVASVIDIIADDSEPRKFQLIFEGAPSEIQPVKLVHGGKVYPLRNIRYTHLEALRRARSLDQLWPTRAAS